jgi:polyisoprenoid-binding protein YceI
MRIRIGARAALVLVLALGTASAAGLGKRQAIIDLDPGNTHIGFTLTGFPHTTIGTFKLKRGEIRIDPETGKVDGNIVVDASSGTSGVDLRDARMRDSILEAQRYPEISFAPQLVRGNPLPQGDFTMTVTGVFSLHGDQHDMTMEVAIHRTADTFVATTHLVIPYVRWGLENPSVLVLKVSDTVKIDVSAAGHVTWAPAQ